MASWRLGCLHRLACPSHLSTAAPCACPLASTLPWQAVFQRGLAHVPQALRQDSPADVPAILGVWVAGGCWGVGTGRGAAWGGGLM